MFEGSYATDPFTPSSRIREFKKMVMALHKAGIHVIMDVVYNHVNDLESSNFERTAPGYFSGKKDDLGLMVLPAAMKRQVNDP